VGGSWVMREKLGNWGKEKERKQSAGKKQHRFIDWQKLTCSVRIFTTEFRIGKILLCIYIFYRLTIFVLHPKITEIPAWWNNGMHRSSWPVTNLHWFLRISVLCISQKMETLSDGTLLFSFKQEVFDSCILELLYAESLKNWKPKQMEHCNVASNKELFDTCILEFLSAVSLTALNPNQMEHCYGCFKQELFDICILEFLYAVSMNTW